MPEADPNDIKAEQYIEFFDWLHELSLSDEYATALKAYRLVTPDTWAGYDLYEMTGLKEQLILESAAIKLRKRWKLNRPSFLGRKFKSNAETQETPDTESTETACDKGNPQSEGSAKQRRRRNRKRRVSGDESKDNAGG